MTERARGELLQVIDQIAELAKKRQEIGRERQKIWDKTSVIRAKLIIDIATAKDDKGKPIYSNEQLREAALTLRLDEHDEYQKLKERLRELDDQEESITIEHNRLVDRRMLLMLELGLASPPSSESI